MWSPPASERDDEEPAEMLERVEGGDGRPLPGATSNSVRRRRCGCCKFCALDCACASVTYEGAGVSDEDMLGRDDVLALEKRGMSGSIEPTRRGGRFIVCGVERIAGVAACPLYPPNVSR